MRSMLSIQFIWIINDVGFIRIPFKFTIWYNNVRWSVEKLPSAICDAFFKLINFGPVASLTNCDKTSSISDVFVYFRPPFYLLHLFTRENFAVKVACVHIHRLVLQLRSFYILYTIVLTIDNSLHSATTNVSHLWFKLSKNKILSYPIISLRNSFLGRWRSDCWKLHEMQMK